MNVLSLFDGISCGQIALNRAGIEYDKYYASEIDKNAIKVTQHNYPDTIQLGDIKKVCSIDLPDIDLLIGGSPCQGFSFAGKQLNFEDPRSKLFFEYVRLLKELEPKYFLLENVKMKKEYQNTISQYLGCEPIMINSSLVSAQNRERLYWTNIPFEMPEDKGLYLRDIFMGGLDITDRVHRKEACTAAYKNCHGATVTLDKKSFCLTTGGQCISNNGATNIKIGPRYFTLTAEECEKLQTVPVGYTSLLATMPRMHALGNGWTVDVIAHIFKGLK